MSPTLTGGLFTTEPPGKARCPIKHPYLPLHLRYRVKCLQNVGPLRQVASGGPVVKTSPSSPRTAGLIPGQEDPLKKEMATHSSILAWEISWTEEPGRL